MHGLGLTIVQEDLNSTLGGVETAGPLPGQAYSFLKEGQGLFQSGLTLFEGLSDSLQALKDVLKRSVRVGRGG